MGLVLLRKRRTRYHCPIIAGVAELVDAVDSKSTGGNTLRVRVSSPVPFLALWLLICRVQAAMQPEYNRSNARALERDCQKQDLTSASRTRTRPRPWLDTAPPELVHAGLPGY